MDILTKRQKLILTKLLHEKSGLNIEEFTNAFKVSKRTVYREIDRLQGFLKKTSLKIVHQHHVYFIQGSRKAITELKANLSIKAVPDELSIRQRQSAIMILLLLSDEPQKILNLALDLNVSETTISNDLNLMNKSFQMNGIKLEKKRGLGIYVQVNEEKRRDILTNIFLSEINDYEFFCYLHDQTDQVDDFFVAMLPGTILKNVALVLNQTIFSKLNIENDQELIKIILAFTITVLRIKKGQQLQKITKININPSFTTLVADFDRNITAKIDVKINSWDKAYLAQKLASVDKHQAELHYDNDYELSISLKVKKFINLVSKEAEYDFKRNTSFINKITSHILGLLENNVEPLPNTKIETLENLRKRFPNLYKIIKKVWAKEFQQYPLSLSELELLLLYFANEYTNINNKTFAALIVCENGIGVSSILRSRIMQEIPNINNITLSKISDLQNLNLKKYNLILSTTELRNFTHDYLLVSPLLPKEQVTRIKNYLAHPRIKNNQVKQQSHDVNTQGAEKRLSQATIDLLFCNELVNSIKVEQITTNYVDIIDLIAQCLLKISSSVVRDGNMVAQKIYERIKIAPVGIPDSNIALFHTSNIAIKRCQFTIFDLKKKLKLESMDHNYIDVNRILLMLGPDNLSSAEQKVMSLISSMIIMNDVNLKLFSVGSEQQIKDVVARECLTDILYKY
ncbi:HTH domain-containing protein [Lactobacillus sp. ESL0785]|uniref:BglG family transcription antiterminator n=1 Tax=Lactobacillus sp. ESL0785 TaxID=2983232 RepID=UPI0023F895B9|nr:HTH domain-containing protein [Lactobacillus sp. ESL0785]WEV71189.1 HTH domain-containing protein [Lactobacillus sp. ESL0785]